MLGAAEADLEPQYIDRCGKQRAQVGGSGLREVEREPWQERFEQGRLTRLERMPLAAPEEGTFRSFFVVTRPMQAAAIR
jgi:hypothetical protein